MSRYFVKLDKRTAIDRQESEESLYDSGTEEAIYVIRTLNSLLEYGDDWFGVDEEDLLLTSCPKVKITNSQGGSVYVPCVVGAKIS
ncbi:hypothetical protein [Salmonella phage SSBI34]|nr:hypothetical protein [Salmonella phage SSBI34]